MTRRAWDTVPACLGVAGHGMVRHGAGRTMTAVHGPSADRSTQGFGLVELMAALALGALLALAACSLLLSSYAAYLRHTETTRLDSSGRQALAIMVRAVSQAGYAAPAAGATAAPPAPASFAGTAAASAMVLPISGLDAATISRDSHGIASPLSGAVNGSDVLVIRFAGSGSGAGDGSITDCAGFAIGADDEGWSIFYVAVGADGEAELRCKYLGKSGNWGADAVVRGVDTLQILYGVDTDEPADGVPNRYLNATQINALGTDAAGASWWTHVGSVRIALLLHGESGSNAGAGATAYDLFGSGYTALAGSRDAGVRFDERALPAAQRQRIRRVIGATVVVRNGGGA